MKTPARIRRRPRPTEPPAPARDLDGMLKRLHLPTVRRLHDDLATRAEAEGMSYRTYLETLITEEIAHRSETRLTRAVRAARFPFVRTIEDFNFTFQTALKLQMLGSYLGSELVREGKSAILSGPSGTGKQPRDVQGSLARAGAAGDYTDPCGQGAPRARGSRNSVPDQRDAALLTTPGPTAPGAGNG